MALINLPDLQNSSKQPGAVTYVEERRRLKKNDPTKSKGAFNPTEEYKKNDNIMCHYYDESETMRKRTDGYYVREVAPIVRRQRRFKSI